MLVYILYNYCICYRSYRLSRFQKSAGLDDYNPSSGRNSPVLSASPGMPKFTYEPCPTLAYPNPRYPPYPLPIVLKPLIQLRQPLLQNLIGNYYFCSQSYSLLLNPNEESKHLILIVWEMR